MGTGRAYGRREQAAGASALVLFICTLHILGVFTPTPPLPGEPRSTSICDVARPAGPIIGTFTTTPVRIGELKGTIRALLEDPDGLHAVLGECVEEDDEDLGVDDSSLQ